MKKNKKSAKFGDKLGFTLIELLIVIGIIGILASIALVRLDKSRERSNGAAFKAGISSLKAAIAMCCTESSNYLMSTSAISGWTAGPRALCVNSAGVAVGTSKLPTAAELKIGGTVDYYTRTNSTPYASACSVKNPEILVRALNNTKNPNCSNLTNGTNGWYIITANGIVHGGANSWNPNAADKINGFPPGC